MVRSPLPLRSPLSTAVPYVDIMLFHFSVHLCLVPTRSSPSSRSCRTLTRHLSIPPRTVRIVPSLVRFSPTSHVSRPLHCIPPLARWPLHRGSSKMVRIPCDYMVRLLSYLSPSAGMAHADYAQDQCQAAVTARAPPRARLPPSLASFLFPLTSFPSPSLDCTTLK